MPRNQFMFNHEEGEEVNEETEESTEEEEMFNESLRQLKRSTYITDDHLEALRQKRMQDLLNESYNSEERVVD